MKTLATRKSLASLENKKIEGSLNSSTIAGRFGSSQQSNFTDSHGCTDVDYYDASGQFVGRLWQIKDNPNMHG